MRVLMIAMPAAMLAAMLAAMCAAPALADIAGTPTFNWSQPTAWSDGAPLTAAQITGYQLVCTGANAVNVRIATAAGVPPYQSTRLDPGPYTCTLAVYAKRSTASLEVRSDPSSPVSFTVPQPVPNAPAGFSVD